MLILPSTAGADCHRQVTGAQAGDVITLTLNGKDYTAMLDGAGNWSVGVPAADVGALANGDQTISATLTDKAGNSTSATHAFDVSPDRAGDCHQYHGG